MKSHRYFSTPALRIVILLLGLFYFGCSDNLGIVEPVVSSDYSNVGKIVPRTHTLSLPEPENKFALQKSNGIFSLYSTTETINGLEGGKVEVEIEYLSAFGQKIGIQASLKFLENSFKGETDVTLYVNLDNQLVFFSKKVKLEIQPEYDFEISGLDVSGLDQSMLDFITEDSKGEIDRPVYEKLDLSKRGGKIKVENAKLNYTDKIGIIVDSPDWVNMPYFDQLVPTDGLFSTTELINGEKGGEVKLDGKYKLPDGRKINYKSKLKFARGAFEGDKEITNTLRTKFAVAQFLPHVDQFNIPAEYDLELEGLDLFGVDPNNVMFVYENPNGDLECVQFEKMEVDIEKGKLKIEGALLPHFSRFGFVK